MSIVEIVRRPRGIGANQSDSGGYCRPAHNNEGHGAAIAAARTSRWLVRQPHHHVEFLLSSGRLKEFRKNAVIVAAQEEGEGLHFLLSGTVQVALPSLLEEMCVVHFLSPFEWFGALSATTSTLSTAEFRARTGCMVLTISRRTLVELMRSSPSFVTPMMELVAESSQRFAEILAETSGLTPVGRLLAKMLSLSAHAMESRGRESYCLPISQAELGKICCASRTTVNRVLHELEAEGILSVGYAQIEIRKRDELLKYLKKGCA